MKQVNIEQPAWMSDLYERMLPYPTPASLDELSSEPYTDPIFSEIDLWLRTSASRFGSVYGYAQEQDGATVQNLFPIQKDATEQISSSSAVTLEMHTETAFHRYKPTTFLLLCVREDHNAGTNIAKLADILPKLDPQTKTALKKYDFITEIDASFRSGDCPQQPMMMQVLNESETVITYDRALMVGTTPEAERALNALSDAIDAVTTTIYLKTGDLLITDNKRIVHGRTPFTARFDGTDRWLKRVMVTTENIPGDQIEYRQGRYRVVTTPL